MIEERRENIFIDLSVLQGYSLIVKNNERECVITLSCQTNHRASLIQCRRDDRCSSGGARILVIEVQNYMSGG